MFNYDILCIPYSYTCYHPFLEEFGKFLVFKFGLLLNGFNQKLFPIIYIFSKIFCPLYCPKQIKNGLGVTETFYSSMKINIYFQPYSMKTFFFWKLSFGFLKSFQKQFQSRNFPFVSFWIPKFDDRNSQP